MSGAASRRTVLGGLAAIGGGLLLGGCTRGSAQRGPATDPAVAAAMAAAVADEQALIDRYDELISTAAGLDGVFSALRADHVAHLSVWSRHGRAAPAASSGAAAGRPPVTLRALRDAEAAAAAARARDCVTAPASVAALLGSVAGCEATHATILASLPTR